MLLVAIVAMAQWHLSEYALTPGDATPVGPLVRIDGVVSETHHGTIMLTDVYLESLTAWRWFQLQFSSHVEFISASQLVEPGVPTDELVAQGYLEMSDSKQGAEVSAFRALGWQVPSRPTGVIVNAVVNPSPARTAHLHVADEIVAVNGRAVRSVCSMIAAVHDVAPKTLVRLSVDRATISSKGVITWRPTSTVRVVTAPAPTDLGLSGCAGVSGSGRSWIGVALEDGVHYALPAKVSINTADIGGPSAGLAMTLTLIDKMSRSSITGGQPIAATGTIDVNGNVGDVGGVAEKTVAVQRGGAKYFIVPQVEVSTAEHAASAGLKIIGVTTLAQALNDLRAIGGARPVPLTAPR